VIPLDADSYSASWPLDIKDEDPRSWCSLVYKSKVTETIIVKLKASDFKPIYRMQKRESDVIYVQQGER
jgi:hypothetical protein